MDSTSFYLNSYHQNEELQKKDFICELPQELRIKILFHLKKDDLLNCYLVSRGWRVIMQDLNIQKAIILEIAFGALKWNVHFRICVSEPPLPCDITNIWASPCPLFPERKIRDTHLLALIYEGMTPQNLEAFIWNAQPGRNIRFGYTEKNPEVHLAEPSLSRAYWAIIINGDFLINRDDPWEDQQVAAVTRKPLGYEFLSTAEAAAFIFIEHAQAGKRLYREHPYIYNAMGELF